VNLSDMPSHNHAWPEPSNHHATGDTGGGQPHANMQPSLGLNYIIALQGTSPVSGGGGLDDGFIGEISLFAGNFAPRGWAFAEGQLLPVSGNDALFSILGTMYGGDGETTFALPDLRGRAAIGPRTGAGLSYRTIGHKLGDEEVTLNIGQLPSHNHTVPEPSTLTVVLLGMAGLIRRRRQAA
jgi:microcystin-dependent protein